MELDQPQNVPTDEEVLEGGPDIDATPEPDPAPDPVLVQVRVNGKTLSVTQDVADAILEREESYQQRMSQQGAELGRLRQQVQTRPEEPTPQDEDLQFFESPSRAIKQHTMQLRNEIRQEYQLEQERQVWWGEFYRDNPTLVGKERLVQAVVAQDFETLKDLNGPQARKALAASVVGLIGGPAPRPSIRKTLSNQPATVEGSTGPTSSPRTQPAADTTQGITGILRARAEARRKARTGT